VSSEIANIKQQTRDTYEVLQVVNRRTRCAVKHNSTDAGAIRNVSQVPTLPSVLKSWHNGPSLKIEYYNNRGKKKYAVLVRAKVFGTHLLVLRLSGQLHSFYKGIPSISQLSLPNLVPENSPIFEACRQGNTQYAYKLLNEGKARPIDVTPSNHTPLSVRNSCIKKCM